MSLVVDAGVTPDGFTLDVALTLPAGETVAVDPGGGFTRTKRAVP